MKRRKKRFDLIERLEDIIIDTINYIYHGNWGYALAMFVFAKNIDMIARSARSIKMNSAFMVWVLPILAQYIIQMCIESFLNGIGYWEEE